MAVNREHFRQTFLEFPSWSCPRCSSGTLIEEKTARKTCQPAWSERECQHEASEPDWHRYRFITMLKCTVPSCGEFVCLTGDATNAEVGNYHDDQEWVLVFTPLTAYPGIPLIPLDKSWPQEVVENLKAASENVWRDPSAAANRLRAAIEQLLNNRKIKKTTVNKNGRKVYINLHDRILNFATVNNEASKSLLAIKWLGNSGSHSVLASLTREDVLDGFDLFEHVLNLVYGKHTARLARLTKVINKRRGPARTSQRK